MTNATTVKAAREAAGLSAREAAAIVGVATITWQRWEGQSARATEIPYAHWSLFLLLTGAHPVFVLSEIGALRNDKHWQDLIDDLRSRINPAYAAQLGTESYERRLCAEALDALISERGSTPQYRGECRLLENEMGHKHWPAAIGDAAIDGWRIDPELLLCVKQNIRDEDENAYGLDMEQIESVMLALARMGLSPNE